MSYPQKLIAILLCTVFFIFFLISMTKTPSSSPSISSKAVADTILSFEHNPIVVADNKGNTDILIDTGENTINFVQIKLSFNPKVISELSFARGSIFKNDDVLQNHMDTEKGTATFIIALPKNHNGIKGRQVIATVSFKTILRDGDTTPLSFKEETLVTSDQYTSSVLKQTISTKIIQEKN